MTKPSAYDLDADEIVTAAVEIFRESGLDAVSMRSVATRLGVSPVPLYSRIGNKDALVDAIPDDGFRADAAVQACRLLMWATVGFVAVESGARPPRRPRAVRPGGDAGGVDTAEADALFTIHIRHLVDGIAREVAAEESALVPVGGDDHQA